MNFFRMIKMDFTRMLLSGKFYFAIAGAMLVTVLNISQEAMQSRWNVSVYYLVVSSHGVGAFFEVFSVLAVLPFALSYWEDSRNGYLRCIETRIGRTAYCWSHLVVAFFGSVISIFLGMAVVYGVLAFVLVSTPALFYYASQLVAEALQLPGQMRWYQLHGGSIRNFKDFFVIAGYFLILTGMEGVLFVRMVKRREQNG